MLSDTQIADFHRHGFVCGLPLLSAAQVRRVQHHLPRRKSVSRLLHAVACEPNLLAMIRTLLGPDVLLRNIDVFIKRPHSVQRTGWHIDTCASPDAANGMINVWVALTEATRQNGCMQYLSGWHQRRIPQEGQTLQTLTFSPATLAALPLQEAVAAEMPAGHMTLHAYRTPHFSGPNTTELPRIGLAMRYFSAHLSSKDAACGQAMVVCGQSHGWTTQPQVPVMWNVQHQTVWDGPPGD